MEVLIQDVRYAVRQLLRQPGTSIVQALTLALGNRRVDCHLLGRRRRDVAAAPVSEPRATGCGRRRDHPSGRASVPTDAFDGGHAPLAAGRRGILSRRGLGPGPPRVRGRIVDGPELARIEVSQFTEAYLSMHGVTPLLGRDFTREDTEFDAPAVALLGYGYWQSRYAGRRDVIGETMRLNDGVATIVGVLPASFDAGIPLARPLRIRPDEVSLRGTGRVTVYARLRPGVTVEQASADLSARMASEPLPEGSTLPARVCVSSRLESAVSRYRTTVSILELQEQYREWRDALPESACRVRDRGVARSRLCDPGICRYWRLSSCPEASGVTASAPAKHVANRGRREVDLNSSLGPPEMAGFEVSIEWPVLTRPLSARRRWRWCLSGVAVRRCARCEHPAVAAAQHAGHAQRQGARGHRNVARADRAVLRARPGDEPVAGAECTRPCTWGAPAGPVA